MKRSAFCAPDLACEASYSGLAERRCPSGEPAIGFWLGCPPAGKPFLDSFSNLGNIKTMPRILGRARATEPAVRVPWIRSNRRSGAADCRPHGSHDGHQVPQAPALHSHRVLPHLKSQIREPERDAATRAFVTDLSTTPTRVQYRRTTHSSIYGIPVQYGAQQLGARTRDALPRGTSELSPQCAQLHTQLATVPPPSLFKASASAAAREKPVPPR